MTAVDYQTDPSRYRHWRIDLDGEVAYLVMDVDQAGGMGDYELKLNSYDLGVDIELNDAVQRLRNIPGIGVVYLDESDIVRNPLVQRIVQAYEAEEKPRKRKE